VDFKAGETHAIMGENGSGKSTFVKILSGVLAPDGGELVVAGQSYDRIASPRTAQTLGIATVFQEILVVPSQTVLENIWMGMDGEFRWRIPEDRKRTEAEAVLRRLAPGAIDLDAPVESLELSARQVCAVARALVRRPRVLILDESTSALDVETRDRLFAVVRERCSQGSAVIFISHRMDEIDQVADRVTVLRLGETVGTHLRSAISTPDLLRLMSGAGPLTDAFEQRGRRQSHGRTVLKMRGVRLQPHTGTLDTEIHAGEIVGVAGLEGHGQERFVRALAGVDVPAEGDVVRVLDEREVPLVSQREAARLNVVYVPRDRKTEGIFEPLSILDNFSLPTGGRDSRLGFLSDASRRRRLETYVEKLRIRLGNPRDAITTLSGGNQQKVLMSRWLAMEPQVLVLNDPTRGVDLGTKHDIYQLLEGLAGQGVAVVVLSTEIEEHLALMDRVLVFREGALFAEIPHTAITREELVGAFFGESRHHAVRREAADA
jgi:ribose transport system ATP-binding protein/rhamnose transport system ATP-binding protein